MFSELELMYNDTVTAIFLKCYIRVEMAIEGAQTDSWKNAIAEISLSSITLWDIFQI